MLSREIIDEAIDDAKLKREFDVGMRLNAGDAELTIPQILNAELNKEIQPPPNRKERRQHGKSKQRVRQVRSSSGHR